MSGIWHDFSREPELAPLVPVVGAVVEGARRLGIEVLVAGAFARDLLLHYRAGILVARRTEDLDFAISVEGWSRFLALTEVLKYDGAFNCTERINRLRHRTGHLIDIVPFDGVETPQRRIEWPPDGATVMDAFGFREALATAHLVRLGAGVEVRLVTLPALALLKLAAWHDRHLREPRKDAADFVMILRNYLEVGNRNRLFGEFSEWLVDEHFDYDLSGARMLGADIGAMLDEPGLRRLEELLLDQSDEERPGTLPAEMRPDDQRWASSMLRSLLRGLQGYR